ncbi:hypothetical protein Salat_2436600 [Sesamum alatum]|uniref:Uncharacterized protein n=1 Tax=Sesamum alatum TaxID=300844 RepID=A0AAE1XY43_9LAMI|nr:hypothetical protein Salat_2436600 [Sesamum alatum]
MVHGYGQRRDHGFTSIGSNWRNTSFFFLERGTHFGGFSSPTTLVRPHVSSPKEAMCHVLSASQSPVLPTTDAPSLVGESLVNIPLVFSAPSSPKQGCSSSSLLHHRVRRACFATGSRSCVGRKWKFVGGNCDCFFS